MAEISAPVEVGSLSHYFLGSYTSQVVGNGISEPSTVVTSSLLILGYWADQVHSLNPQLVLTSKTGAFLGKNSS